MPLTKEEEIAFLEQQAKNAQLQTQNAQLQEATTMFEGQDDDNLIKWQLDVEEDLESIQRLLRRDRLVTTGRDKIWVKPKNEEDQLFNDEGIAEIMSILQIYLSKTFILSNFSEKQIEKRMADFSHALIDLIFNCYERFGWVKYNEEKGYYEVDKEKSKHYVMVVNNIIAKVEAAYNRALKGGERDSLKTARIVNQTENVVPQPQYPPQRRVGLLGRIRGMV